MRPYRLLPHHQVVLCLVGVPALAVCCGGGGKSSGQDSGKLGFSRCIEDWPTSNGPHPTKPSLTVDAPKVVWRTQINWGLYGGGLVVSKDRLAFPTADYVFFVGKDGSEPQKVGYNALGEPPSGLVADTDGNIYYVTHAGAYSVDAAGKLRWQRSLGDSPGSEGEYTMSFPPVLGPDGVVYAVTSSQKAYALKASDGSTLWSKPAPGDQSPSYVLGGAGKGLFLSRNGQQVIVLSTEDGETTGALSAVLDGKNSPIDSNLIILGWDRFISAQGAFVFDTCGNLKWSTFDKTWKTVPVLGLIAPPELIVSPGQSYDGSQWSNTDLRLYDLNGNVVASSTPYQGYDIAIGADGTIYTVNDRTILAYSEDLKEQWRLDLGSGAKVTGMVVLDDDGMLYLVHPSESTGTEVVGIQTRSPGLANSSWPSLRHDNRGTAWLVPGVPSSTTPNP